MPARKFWAGRKGSLPVAGVVQHYTASLADMALVRWMVEHSNNSAHLYFLRSGETIQTVKFSDRAIHAGEKKNAGFWLGQPQEHNANHFTIGFENCNAGWLIRGDSGRFYLPKKKDDGTYTFGKLYEGPTPQLAKDHLGVERYWEPYTEELVAANIEALKQTVDKYPAIEKDCIEFHSGISPHRKYDPGPLWPHAHVLGEVFGSGGEEDSNKGTRGDADNAIEGHYSDDQGMCLIEPVDDSESF